MALKPWSKDESSAFNIHIAEQDARIRSVRRRYSLLSYNNVLRYIYKVVHNKLYKPRKGLIYHT